jgi:fluoroquinolone transport system permease protein
MRLAATIRCDLRLQWRNGFYYASAVVVVGFIALLKLLPEPAVGLLLPVIVFQNVVVNSFYFGSGLLLLERGESTRAAQAVTPLRAGEYLGSKVLTLGALSLAESWLIVLVLQGIGPGVVELTVGIMLASAIMTMIGAALVCRYRSLNEFIMPSVLYTMLLAIPMLGWFGLGATAIYDWHPLQGPLGLMGARAVPLSTGRLAYAVTWPLLWIGPVYLWSRRAIAGSARA